MALSVCLSFGLSSAPRASLLFTKTMRALVAHLRGHEVRLFFL
jgi:hypothetical protein